MNLMSRDDFASLLFAYLNPLLPHYSERGARLLLAGGGATYEDDVISLEAWARPLWGLAPFWAGGGRSQHGSFEKLYARGLISGTDPSSSEYWGLMPFRDHDQRFVEMAAIAYGLILAPDVLWEPLSNAEQEHVAHWLQQINAYELPQGNWLWFRVVVNLALCVLGEPFGARLIEADLGELDGYYLQNGWYQDGPTGLPDYYNAMTFHFFSLLYVGLFESGRLRGTASAAWGDSAAVMEGQRAQSCLDRACAFAADYVRLFSARGEGVPYGRSLTYRFAQAGFWSMAAAVSEENHASASLEAKRPSRSEVNAKVSGIPSLLGEPFSMGVLKGFVARNIKAWNPSRICDNGGVMSIGYHYPNLHMAEGYNAAGSPMWGLMAFACLALSAGDPFWQLEPKPLPEQPTLVRTAMGVSQRDEAGEVVLYPSGRVPGHPFAQSQNKYSKFVYSSKFGFSVSRSACTLEEAAPDSMLAFVINGRVLVRDGVEKSETNSVSARLVSRVEKLLASSQVPSIMGGPQTLLCSDDEQLWNFDTGAAYTATAMDLPGSKLLRGFSAADCACWQCSTWSPWPDIEVRTILVPSINGYEHLRIHCVQSNVVCEAYDCGFAVPGDYHHFSLEDAEKVCQVRGVTQLDGSPDNDTAAEPLLIKAEPNTNITCPKTVIPAVHYEIGQGTAVLLTRVSW